MAPRSIASIKDEARGLEFAEVDLGAGRMRATGVAIDTTPEPYRLDYTLATGDEYVTTELQVSARGQGWRRSLHLVRDEYGEWSANGSREGGLSEAHREEEEEGNREREPRAIAAELVEPQRRTLTLARLRRRRAASRPRRKRECSARAEEKLSLRWARRSRGPSARRPCDTRCWTYASACIAWCSCRPFC